MALFGYLDKATALACTVQEDDERDGQRKYSSKETKTGDQKLWGEEMIVFGTHVRAHVGACLSRNLLCGFFYGGYNKLMFAKLGRREGFI